MLIRCSLLVAVLLLGACSRKPPESAWIDPALLTLVPNDTVLMVGTRIDKLKETPVYQKYLANRKIPQMEEFAQRTGIDPQKDLWSLLFVSNGKDAVLLGRGKFANEAEPKLEREGAKRFGYKGFNLIGDERAAVLFISSSTAAVGTTDALKSLLDHRATSNGPPPALAALLKELPYQSQFFAAYSGGPITLPLQGNLGNLNKVLGSLQSATVYFDLTTGVKGLATGNAITDEGAQEVYGAMRALVGIVRLSTPSNQPDMLRVLDGIRVTQDGRKVRTYIDEPQELVEKTINLWFGK